MTHVIKAAERIRQIGKIHFVGSGTRDLPACSDRALTSALPRVPSNTLCTMVSEFLIVEDEGGGHGLI
jgi:hypothetical protein